MVGLLRCQPHRHCRGELVIGRAMASQHSLAESIPDARPWPWSLWVRFRCRPSRHELDVGGAGRATRSNTKAGLPSFTNPSRSNDDRSCFCATPAFGTMRKECSADEFAPAGEPSPTDFATPLCARDPSEGVGCLLGAPAPGMVRLDSGSGRKWRRFDGAHCHRASVCDGRSRNARRSMSKPKQYQCRRTSATRHPYCARQFAREQLRWAPPALPKKARGALRRREPESALRCGALSSQDAGRSQPFESNGAPHVVALRPARATLARWSTR